MICRRHNALASFAEHGVFYCVGCFREAMIEAEAVALMRRLEGRK